jgi:putative NADH-flavin reductase
MVTAKPLKVAVIGATGYAGSHVCVELIARGHHVIGISRNPEKLGSHPNYSPKSIDLENVHIKELVDAFSGQDVVIEYPLTLTLLTQFLRSPHWWGKPALQYPSCVSNPVPFIEITRKVVLAVKYLKTPYLLMIGGTGSLTMPGDKFATAVDSEDFWVANFQHAADSKAYRSYADARFPKFATMLYRYHDIREQSGPLDDEDKDFLKKMIDFSKSRVTQSHFIMACRASLQFFEGNKDFEWSFLSPSPGFRPGPKTGKYEIGGEAMLPIEGSQEPPFEGRLLGISVKDIAGAIADEAETRKMAGKHWTAWTPSKDAVDIPLESVYGSLSELEKQK